LIKTRSFIFFVTVTSQVRVTLIVGEDNQNIRPQRLPLKNGDSEKHYNRERYDELHGERAAVFQVPGALVIRKRGQ